MKKFLLILISGLLLAGCASLQKSNTLKTAPLEPDVEPLPVAADLLVSEQKVTGEASGKVAEKALLENEALAKALGQEPPSVDKPDVLVGMNVFTEITDNFHLKLTITGYPAYYTNFRTAKEEDLQRLNITKLDCKTPSLGVAQSQSEAQEEIPPKKRKIDYYFAPKYQLPFTEGSGALNLDLEGGLVWGNESFVGVEFGFSVDQDDAIGGTGVNIGRTFDISPFSVVAGMSVGLWVFAHEEEYYNYNYNYGYGYYDYDVKENFYPIAPFVRARWENIELMYRLFPPISNLADGAQQQFMIGYNFATSKRER